MGLMHRCLSVRGHYNHGHTPLDVPQIGVLMYVLRQQRLTLDVHRDDLLFVDMWFGGTSTRAGVHQLLHAGHMNQVTRYIHHGAHQQS